MKTFLCGLWIASASCFFLSAPLAGGVVLLIAVVATTNYILEVLKK